MSGAVARWIEATQAQIDQVVFGVGEAAEAIAMARLAGGHVLLEGVPGMGKTLLARTSASVFGGEFARVIALG